MHGKALWLKENEADIYSAAPDTCEYTDWIIYRLTGEWTASINIASLRWYYDRNNGGFSTSPYVAVGINELFWKVSQKGLDTGTVGWGLFKGGDNRLGLSPGISCC